MSCDPRTLPPLVQKSSSPFTFSNMENIQQIFTIKGRNFQIWFPLMPIPNLSYILALYQMLFFFSQGYLIFSPLTGSVRPSIQPTWYLEKLGLRPMTTRHRTPMPMLTCGSPNSQWSGHSSTFLSCTQDPSLSQAAAPRELVMPRFPYGTS